MSFMTSNYQCQSSAGISLLYVLDVQRTDIWANFAKNQVQLSPAEEWRHTVPSGHGAGAILWPSWWWQRRRWLLLPFTERNAIYRCTQFTQTWTVTRPCSRVSWSLVVLPTSTGTSSTWQLLITSTCSLPFNDDPLTFSYSSWMMHTGTQYCMQPDNNNSNNNNHTPLENTHQQYLCHGLLDFAEIWHVGATWVCRGCRMVEILLRWNHGRFSLQCFDTVGWVIWPVKTRSRYNL